MASSFNVPVINHIHGSEISSLYVNAGERKKHLVEKCFDKCAYLVVLSEEWKNNLQVVKTKTPKIVIENYSTIHNECLKRKAHENKNILFLGFITELKGCLIFLKLREELLNKKIM